MCALKQGCLTQTEVMETEKISKHLMALFQEKSRSLILHIFTKNFRAAAESFGLLDCDHQICVVPAHHLIFTIKASWVSLLVNVINEEPRYREPGKCRLPDFQPTGPTTLGEETGQTAGSV